MGNNDGLIQAISSQGTNQLVNFDGGYFSFALGNEIALVLEGQSRFILNCDSDLFEVECLKTN